MSYIIISGNRSGMAAGGVYLARYARSRGVEIADALIGAAATTADLRLWRLHRKHYPMDDLRFYEPAKRFER